MKKVYFIGGLISTEDRGPTVHLPAQSSGFQRLLKLHFSHLRGSLRPLGGHQSQLSPSKSPPLPPPKPTIFREIQAQASAGTKMEEEVGVGVRTWGLGAFHSSSPPPPHPPGPILAVCSSSRFSPRVRRRNT